MTPRRHRWRVQITHVTHLFSVACTSVISRQESSTSVCLLSQQPCMAPVSTGSKAHRLSISGEFCLHIATDVATALKSKRGNRASRHHSDWPPDAGAEGLSRG